MHSNTLRIKYKYVINQHVIIHGVPFVFHGFPVSSSSPSPLWAALSGLPPLLKFTQGCVSLRDPYPGLTKVVLSELKNEAPNYAHGTKLTTEEYFPAAESQRMQHSPLCISHPDSGSNIYFMGGPERFQSNISGSRRIRLGPLPSPMNLRLWRPDMSWRIYRWRPPGRIDTPVASNTKGNSDTLVAEQLNQATGVSLLPFPNRRDFAGGIARDRIVPPTKAIGAAA